MRVLLDEQLPHSLRHHFSHHDVMTAAYAGLAGLKNGALLTAAEEAGFEVLVTGDRTLHYEQDLSEKGIYRDQRADCRPLGQPTHRPRWVGSNRLILPL